MTKNKKGTGIISETQMNHVEVNHLKMNHLTVYSL